MAAQQLLVIGSGWPGEVGARTVPSRAAVPNSRSCEAPAKDRRRDDVWCTCTLDSVRGTRGSGRSVYVIYNMLHLGKRSVERPLHHCKHFCFGSIGSCSTTSSSEACNALLPEGSPSRTALRIGPRCIKGKLLTTVYRTQAALHDPLCHISIHYIVYPFVTRKAPDKQEFACMWRGQSLTRTRGHRLQRMTLKLGVVLTAISTPCAASETDDGGDFA